WGSAGAELQRARTAGLAAYAIGATVAVYSHTTLVLVPLLANLWALPRFGSDLMRGARRPPLLAGWVLANLAV
ncbi:hypothetical protein, partial [Pseudomonas aeruginosa]|uniref:hypothetical protein n=1 Tax=Pseudomonas aeruginosa TaxID=287 RepID=UPI00397DE32A